jgi:hypothetical protein
MRWLIVVLVLAGCRKKADCPAAMKAASQAVWAYQPADKQRDAAWQRSIDRSKANNDALHAAIEKTPADCHSISIALQHPKDANVELLSLGATQFRQDITALEKDPTLDPTLVKKMQVDEPAFDAAIAQVPPPKDGSVLRPTAASTKALEALETAWCALQTSYAPVHDDELNKLKAKRDASLAESDKIGAQSKVDSDHWTQAQDFAKAIDAHKAPTPLTAPGDLATEPGFGSARAALAAANAACE